MEPPRTFILLSTAVLILGTLAQPPAAERSATSPSAPHQEAPTSTAEPEVPGPYRLLADSFGVDLSKDALIRRLTREAEFARDPANPRRDEAKKFMLEIGPLLSATKAQPLDIPKRQLESVQLAVLKEVARRQNVEVTFLIATLPDPIDSFTGWQFDPMLEAISQAIAASDYVFERYDFPDAVTQHDKAAAAERRGRAHEDQSNLVLFRRHIKFSDGGTSSGGDGDDTADQPVSRERLLLQIVHENPSAGVHSRALLNALALVTAWTPTCGPNRVIPILGPTFSGSAESLRSALVQASRRGVLGTCHVRFVSGSATDQSNEAVIEGAIKEPRVTFSATVQPDQVLLPTLIEHVRRSGWSLPIGVLYEGNTQYGRSLAEQLVGHGSGLEPADLTLLPFSMNVSRIRHAAQRERPGLAEALGLPARFRPLSMDPAPMAEDQIPSLSPQTTASYVELGLASALRALRTERVGTVAIMATDPRDKLFLASQIARDAPNVSLFTVESDALYVHPEYSYYMEGALVASTYPLYSGNQRWSPGASGIDERRQFANGNAVGIYNAALVLLHYDELGAPLRPAPYGEERPPRPIEYGMPGIACSQRCVPPVWISVVGKKGAWPIKPYAVSAPTYTYAIQGDGTAPNLATHVSPGFVVGLTFLTALALAAWIAVADRSRFAATVVVTPSDPGDEAQRCTLVGVGALTLLLLLGYIGAVQTARMRLDAAAPFATAAWSAAAIAITVAAAGALVHVILLQMSKARELQQGVPRSGQVSVLVRPRRLIAGVVAGWAAGSLLWYGWQQVWLSAASTASFVVRATDIGSGVSPTLPVTLLLAAFALWSATELARLRHSRVAVTDARTRELLQASVSGDVAHQAEQLTRLNRSILDVPRLAALVVLIGLGATCVFLFDPFVRPLVSVDGPWFGRFVSGGILILHAMIGLSLLQFMTLWLQMRRLFVRAIWHGESKAYTKVPRMLFPASLFPGAPRPMELEALVDRAKPYLRAAGLRDRADALDKAFKEDMTRSWTYWPDAASWQQVVQIAVGQEATPLPSADRTDLQEMCMTLVIRDAMARLRYNLMFVIGGILCVFCSHTLFPFQIGRHLSVLAWIQIALAFGVIVTVLVQIKSNELLRRVTSPDPEKRGGWDGAFVLRFALLALVPLLTLFAAQFPDTAGILMHWIEPVKKVLP